MRRGTCVHYQGGGFTHETRCAVGVDYIGTFGPHEGVACRAPCIQEYKTHERINGKLTPVWKPWPRHGQTEIPCDKRLMPTQEQIDAEDEEVSAHMQKMTKVMGFVKEWRNKPPRGKAEIVECPVCKGQLHLSQAASNGHVWGRCETDGCVNWME